MKKTLKKLSFVPLCLSLLLFNFHAKAQLKAAFVYGSACISVSDSFIDETTGGTPPYTYHWDFGNTKTSISQNASAAYDSAGTYNVVLHVTDAKGDTNSISKQLTVYEPPRAVYTAVSHCGYATYNASVAANSSTTITSYIWSGQGSPGYGPLYLTGAKVGYVFTKPGTYHYTLTVSNSHGCSRTYLDSVTILPIPEVLLPPDTAVCENTTLIINATVLNAKRPYNILWSGSPNASNSVTCTIHTDTTLAVLVKDATGCTNYDSMHITALPLPDAHWSLNYSGTSTSFTAGSSLPDSDYLWKFGDGDSAMVHNALHIYKHAKSYDISLYVTTQQGCKSHFDSIVNITDAGVKLASDALADVQVYPNPFYASATVQYTLPQKSDVSVSIYNAQGKSVAVIAKGNQPAGAYQFDINAPQYDLNPGVYYVKLVTGEGAVTRELVMY